MGELKSTNSEAIVYIAEFASYFQHEADGAERRQSLYDEIMSINNLSTSERVQSLKDCSRDDQPLIDYIFTIRDYTFKHDFIDK